MSDLKYLIPFDRQYFLLGINLIQNLIDCKIPANKIFVVDFGLKSNQLDFLSEASIEVLRTPPHLIGSHPYKLKSHLADYLQAHPLKRGYLIQLDADMLLLKNPETELTEIIQAMEQAHAQIALCPDMGPKNTHSGEIGPSIKDFVARYPCPVFQKLLPKLSLQNPYLNTGFVIYAPTFDLTYFQEIADQMAGEVVWEQNAINLICASHPDTVYPLNPKDWNLHGKLMEEYDVSQHPFFIHITSATPNSISTGPIHLQIKQQALESFYFRQAHNSAVLSIQDTMLKSLLERNQALFLKHLTIS